MSSSEIRQRLFDEIVKLPVIDCHEHLGPESDRVAAPVDATVLFCHYCRSDLVAAGMPPRDFDRMCEYDIPADYRWGLLSPWLDHIRHGSYARAAFIAAKELFGFEDVNDGNHAAITAKMREHNTPGLYRRVLRDKCNIRVALTQCGRTQLDSDLLVPLMWMPPVAEQTNWNGIVAQCAEDGVTPASLDDLTEACERRIVRWKGEGAIGLKLFGYGKEQPDRAEAVSAFEALRSGAKRQIEGPSPLRPYLLDRCLAIAAKHDLPVACHTGMWGDFRTLDPLHLIPLIERHPNTRFDVYHAGMPWVRETGVIGKNNPNVWLNLAWCHIISQRMTVSLLDEWLDLVPVNKIFAFGGDYGLPVEKVVGHLRMAQEDIAEVLARRVKRGDMTEDRALEIARMWFFENPLGCYTALKDRALDS